MVRNLTQRNTTNTRVVGFIVEKIIPVDVAHITSLRTQHSE